MAARSDSFVAVFCGHMADREGREKPRFPPSAEGSVSRRIRDWLAANPVRVAFSGAACGSDILFLEAALEAEIEIHILLPFAAEEFVQTSVASGGVEWVERFRRVFERASTLTIVNDEVADADGSVFDFTNRLVAAKGVLCADGLGMGVRGLTVWNGLRGDGGGGTADAVSCWIKAGIPVHVIHPLEPALDGPARGEESIPPVPFPNLGSALPSGSRGEVGFFAHFHFADYHRFPEALFPRFQRLVLNPLAAHLAESGHRTLGRYGFGGDYVLAFAGVRAALETASGGLAAVLRSLASADGGIAPPSVCLHVGPVQFLVNPVLNQYCHEGGVLLRAARAVRDLPPGNIFCTEPFAALSALEAVRHFRFQPAAESAIFDRLFLVTLDHA
jgi:hypothetical protein